MPESDLGRGARLVPGRLQQPSGFVDAVELEKRLYLLRSLARFGVDVLDDFPPGKRQLRMLCRPGNGGSKLGCLRLQLVLAGGLDAPDQDSHLTARYMRELQRHLCHRRIVPLVDMRSVLGDRDATCASAAQPSNVPGKYEVDGINNAALARPIRADDHERLAIHLQFQLTDAPELLDAELLELDHSADSPAALA